MSAADLMWWLAKIGWGSAKRGIAVLIAGSAALGGGAVIGTQKASEKIKAKKQKH